MTHLSAMEIDGLASGHLDVAGGAAHVASCERCRADLDTAKAAMTQFTREVLPRTLPKLAPQRASWRKWLPAIVVPILAAAALLLWLGHKAAPTPAPDNDDILVKGDTTFQVFAKRGASVIELRDGTKLRAGDAIRFIAEASTARYLLIGSVDGSGTASLYYPFGGPRSGAIGKTAVELPGSIVLDAAQGPERLFALFSTEPLEGDAVTRALVDLGRQGGEAIRETRTLSLPGVTSQATLLFEKEAP